MYLHENNRELFKDLISITSERMGIREEIIEKDYYVTMILRLLAETNDKIVFKGGTSLSKAFEIIDRFSEDIDITFTEHIGESRRKRLKYEILKPIEVKLKMDIKNWAYIESDKNYNHYDYYYNSVLDNSMGGLPPYIKLETALMSYSFPTEEKYISNYIYKAFAVDEPDIMKMYQLEPFIMKVQSLNRTMVDKIFAICDYYMLGRTRRNSRHLYDIYKLSSYVKLDGSLEN